MPGLHIVFIAVVAAVAIMNGAVIGEETTSVTKETITTEVTASTAATGGSHGSNCTSDVNCDISTGLSCSEGKCGCARPKEMIYDQNKTACIVLESFSCDKTSGLKSETFECTKYSACIAESNPSHDNQTKTCTCNSGYSPTGNRKCLADFNTNCDLVQELCNNYTMLMCHIVKGETIGKCGCTTPEENVYESGKCLTLAGGSCTQSTPPYILDCVANATCHMQNNTDTKNTTGICECVEGLDTLENGRCSSSVSKLLGSAFVTAILAILCIQCTKYM